MDTSMSSASNDSSTLTTNTSFLSDNLLSSGVNTSGTNADYSSNASTKFWSSTPTSTNFNNLSFTNYSVQPQIQNQQQLQSPQQGQQMQNYAPKLQYSSSLLRTDEQPTTSTSNNSLMTNASSISTSTSNNKYNKPILNINAPSYVPDYANYNTNNSNTMNDKYKYYYNNTNMNRDYETSSSGVDLTEDYNKLKLELFLKNQMIKNLTEQINSMNKMKNSVEQAGGTTTNSFKVPKNHYQLFQDLSKTLQEKSDELEETKSRLEAVLVSLAQSNTPTMPADYNYDVQELSHKLINKLSELSNENENLLKMVSYGNKTSLLIEIGLLRHELEQLRSKERSTAKEE